MPGFGAAVGLQGYAGRVMSNATMTAAPVTWTCQHVSLGTYTVTHNLQLDPNKYVVIAHCAADPTTGSTPNVYAYIEDQSANSFTITTATTPPGVPGPSDQSFNFILILAGGPKVSNSSSSKKEHPQATAAPPPMTLTNCNTITLTATVPQRMIAPASGRYMINILNLGPGTVYYRFDGDSSVADPLSVTVPLNMMDNDIHIDGTKGVSVCSDQNTTISIRGRML